MNTYCANDFFALFQDLGLRNGYRPGVYLRPRVLVMLPLGFAAGLPYLLTGTTLQAILAEQGMRLAAVGAYSLIGLSYSGKFLWAPLLDRVYWPGMRRRGWLMATQAALIAALFALGRALRHAQDAPGGLAALALLTAVLSATQDIASDAYRADLLLPDEAAAGTATYVLGYRAAMIVAGAGALRLLGWLSPAGVYAVLAILLLPALLFTALAPEPPPPPPPPDVTPEPPSLLLPLRSLLRRPQAGVLLALVLVYRVGDTLVNGVLLPFLLRAGYPRAQVADAVNVFGLLATIVGALWGGRLAARLGLLPALLLFGALQAGANLGYALLALRPPDPRWLWGVVGADHLATGLGVAASGALLLSLCERRHSATQAALLTSLSGVAGRLLGGSAGWLAERLGFPGLFCLSAALGLPGLLILLHLRRLRAAELV